MDITWYVEDGYVGKSRPHHLTIDDEDISDCKTQQEFENLVNDTVQEIFENNISWYVKMPEFKKI